MCLFPPVLYDICIVFKIKYLQRLLCGSLNVFLKIGSSWTLCGVDAEGRWPLDVAAAVFLNVLLKVYMVFLESNKLR